MTWQVGVWQHFLTCKIARLSCRQTAKRPFRKFRDGLINCLERVCVRLVQVLLILVGIIARLAGRLTMMRSMGRTESVSHFFRLLIA